MVASSGACFIFTYLILCSETFLGEKISEVEYLVVVPFIVFLGGLCIGNVRIGNDYK